VAYGSGDAQDDMVWGWFWTTRFSWRLQPGSSRAKSLRPHCGWSPRRRTSCSC